MMEWVIPRALDLGCPCDEGGERAAVLLGALEEGRQVLADDRGGVTLGRAAGRVDPGGRAAVHPRGRCGR